MARRTEKQCFQREYEKYLMEEMEEEERLWDEECAYWEQERDYEEYRAEQRELERLEQEAQLEAEYADMEFLSWLCSDDFLEECLCP